MYLLKPGNHKLSRTIGIWNLPRTSCIGKTNKCYKYCYGKTFERMNTVKHARAFRYDLTQKQTFVDLIVLEIKYRELNKVRIHEVGDFYDQTYLNKWKDIARLCPNTDFLCYTKALCLDLWNNKPYNLIIFQSYDGKYDELIDENKHTARVINDKSELRDNEHLCPYNKSNFDKCGITCKYCFLDIKDKHVAFIIHSKFRHKRNKK